ncbi:hypothetical protein WOLCODRAFT_100880 [Wolfiporia cocos MD-104 SS10]|uniref:Nucleoporin Nup120/160-domain-containing protein n=1 Tax=Wolfiporia cocos (strain MD-104) TaxID=742152 RepID=A0A2H3JJ83_WOLCO|nr:hypothetical protein WOLCODRAFT_100880 [Wolfiporia cocos MD-104 SS10]
MTLTQCGVLVASQLSSLFPNTQPIPVPTTQNSISDSFREPLPGSPLDHASYSTLLYTPDVGTILLRVTRGGTILELLSVSSDLPPLRFDFAAPLLPYPSIVINGKGYLYVIAVTVSGSLYRIEVPVGAGGPSWPPHTSRQWCHEYVVQGLKGGDKSTVVHVQALDCVLASLPSGHILRIEANPERDRDTWTETKQSPYHLGFQIPHLFSPAAVAIHENHRIVSITSCPPQSDVSYFWTLSRDRTLRLWSSRSGFVTEETLSAIAPGRSATHETPASTKSSVLLPPDPQKLLRAFQDPSTEVPYVLVFIPTESSSTSGGFFRLFSCKNDTMETVATFEASTDSAHCHIRDFAISGQILYTLWDNQGQSVVQTIKFSYHNSNDLVLEWQYATYPPEAELTPEYLDELLLSSGSLTDKFFEAIMRPGTFSPQTLQIAIDQYTDSCRSLPPPHPSQLSATYANISEHITAVVGCTVQRTRDPRTGTAQHSQYWNALKRDWEGFIARCREIERSARWPLAIGLGGPAQGVVFIERERLVTLVAEDNALKSHRLLHMSTRIESAPQLLEVIWLLRTKVRPRAMKALEARLLEIARQEVAFPLADIVLDQATQMDFRGTLEEGFDSSVDGLLENIRDVRETLPSVVEFITSYEDDDVKSEEPEATSAESSSPAKPSEWRRATIASYITATINARYELSLSLMTLLFYLANELSDWDPSQLTEIFALFRGLAILRYVAEQPAGDIVTSLPAETAGDDDVVARMRTMHVSIWRSGFRPTHSLIHRLLDRYGGDVYSLPQAAHQFITDVGLLQETSLADATSLEVQFCENLRRLGYREVAREMLAWLPRTHGITYVLGRLWLDEGRFDDAASAMEYVAGCLGPDCALSLEDKAALAAVLPGAQLFESEFDFYLHVAALFRAASDTCHDVSFSQLALSVAPPIADTTSLWRGVIRGLTDLGLYQDAYASLVATPYDRVKRECISQLVYRMCEEDAVEQLMSFNFAGFAEEVEDALSFKTRNADPRIRPFYSRIQYSWYISRGDYRNAALTMYQRARKLASLIGDPESFLGLSDLQLEAYAVGINALALTDQKNAWIVIPATAETEHEPRKRRRLSKHIPEDRYAPGKRDAEIVELVDMQYEYTLLAARKELIRREPTLLTAGGLQLAPPSIVMRLAQMNLFSMAMATACSLRVDMTDLFCRLTRQCLRLSHKPDSVIGEDTSDWLLTDKVTSWPGTPADRGWRYLRESLDRHDCPETDYRYTKVTLETVLNVDRLSPPPPWLIHSIETQHPEYLIRLCLRYDLLESALEHTLRFMRRSDARLTQEQPKTASASWLPYTLIDQVLLAADSQEDISSDGQALRRELRAEITKRVTQVQKFSQASR